MKWIFKLFLYALTTCVLFFALLVSVMVFVGPSIFPLALNNYLHGSTGFSSHISDCSWRFFKGEAQIQNWQIKNPSHYSPADFIDIDHCKARIQWSSLFSNKLQVPLLDLSVRQFTLVHKQDKQLNALEFVDKVKPKEADQKSAREANKNTQEKAKKWFTLPQAYTIQTLNLEIDQIVLWSPQILGNKSKSISLNYRKTFTDVTDISNVAETVKEDLREIILRNIEDRVLSNAVTELVGKPINELIEKTIGNEGIKSKIQDVFNGKIQDNLQKEAKKIFQKLKL